MQKKIQYYFRRLEFTKHSSSGVSEAVIPNLYEMVSNRRFRSQLRKDQQSGMNGHHSSTLTVGR